MAYKFTFASVGGATRVKIHSEEDIRHLGELDQKMWTILSCPTSGLEIADESLQLMDSDADKQLHVNEVIATAQWLDASLNSLTSLFDQTDAVAVSNIKDAAILAIAQRMEKDVITLADVEAKVAAITIDEQAAPAAPYEADVMAAYKAKQAEYAAYFETQKLQKLGLAVIPEDMAVPGMKEKDFLSMGQVIAAYDAAVAAAADANAAALAAAVAEYQPLRKLLLIHRDFVRLLRNFVTFEDFYSRDENSLAIFQAGTLVIDQRACHLCVRVNDMGKQNAQAGASGMFLVYCDCVSKPLGKTIQIVAAVTMGEIKNLTVGKNAIFYDRQGNDYDATITKIVDNPISIRQAFWSPYRKFGQWVTDLINKSASEKNDKAFADMTAKAQETAANPEAAAAADKKSAFDIAKFAGIFAAIGMAIGYIGAFFTSLGAGISSVLHQNFGFLIFLGIILAIMLCISGPAMIMAAIKLRRRNLAPILNANGWAVNADTIVNIMFGATLTDQVQFPLIKMNDPFAKKTMAAWKKWLIGVVCFLVVVVGLWLGNLLRWIPCDYCQSPLPCFNQEVVAEPAEEPVVVEQTAEVVEPEAEVPAEPTAE